jgi:transposase
MSKYSKEFKLEVINFYLSGRGGLKATAYKYSVHHSHVSKWVSAFKAHGEDSLIRRYTSHTQAFKKSVLLYMEKHQLSINQAASHFNIPSPSSISVWQKIYNESGLAALQPKPKGRPPMSKYSDVKALMAKPLKELSHEELLRKAQYLEIENAYLKKLEALAQQKYLAKKNKSK